MTSHLLLNMALPLLLLVAGAAALLIRDLLAAVILLAIYSLLMASAYLALGAPDVAITEAAIGAGVSTLLLLAALLLTGEKEKHVRGTAWPALAALTALAAMLGYAALGLPGSGDPSAPANMHVVPHYLQRAYAETGAPNVVTAVLASYRGYDTLGETFVVFTAAVSVLLLIGLPRRRARRK